MKFLDVSCFSCLSLILEYFINIHFWVCVHNDMGISFADLVQDANKDVSVERSPTEHQLSSLFFSLLWTARGEC